ncbi:MAG TPA: hypothetical protein VIL36_16175, partial [Acidimicrobiales bacterium]
MTSVSAGDDTAPARRPEKCPERAGRRLARAGADAVDWQAMPIARSQGHAARALLIAAAGALLT